MSDENEQMEPPPRLYVYDGLFTSYRSVDLALKMLFVIVIFIIFIFLLAWLISKKSYRRAPKSKHLQLKCISDLFRQDTLKLLSAEKNSSFDGTVTTTVVVGGYIVTVVNKPELVVRAFQSRSIRSYFSAAPGKLRRNWCGLLLSDSILPHRKVLQKTVLQAFNSLSTEVYQQICVDNTDPSDAAKLLLSRPSLTEKDLKEWLFVIISQLLLLGTQSCAIPESTSSVDKVNVSGFLRQWWSTIDLLQQFHTLGKGTTKREEHKLYQPKPEELLVSIDELLKPVILQSFEHIVYHTICSGQNESQKHARTFLMQLLLTHHHLEKYGQSLDFLSVSHVAHILSEVALLLDHLLFRTLNLLFFALAVRQSWQNRARSEVLTYSWKENLNYTENSLHWTQAVIHEAVRLGMLAWPYSCTREVCQDGSVDGYDLAEGDLVLVNPTGYLFSGRHWSESCGQQSAKASIDPGHFSPLRFLTGSQGRQTLRIPGHWRTFLTHALVCVPYKKLHQLLFTLTVVLLRRGFYVHCLSRTAEFDSDVDNDEALEIPDSLPEIIVSYTPFN